jgi:hypothetical protein
MPHSSSPHPSKSSGRARGYTSTSRKYNASITYFKLAIERAAIKGRDEDIRALRVELKRGKTNGHYTILGEKIFGCCWCARG